MIFTHEIYGELKDHLETLCGIGLNEDEIFDIISIRYNITKENKDFIMPGIKLALKIEDLMNEIGNSCILDRYDSDVVIGAFRQLLESREYIKEKNNEN